MGLIKASLVSFVAFIILQIYYVNKQRLEKIIPIPNPEKYEIYLIVSIIFAIEMVLWFLYMLILRNKYGSRG